jgi:acetate kinase
MKKIIIINSGSSSIKFKIFSASEHKVVCFGIAERITIDGYFSININDQKITTKVNFPNHQIAIEYILDCLLKYQVVELDEIIGIGHRIVNGGHLFTEATVITKKLLIQLEACNNLAPLHNPGAVLVIKSLLLLAPNIPNVVCFDTSFHSSLPQKKFLYATPYK